MNNFIEYFYNIKSDKITFNSNYYHFVYNGYTYKLYVVDGGINVNFIREVNKKLLGNCLVSEIIVNRNNEIISVYNNISYILIKIYVNVNKRITLEEINYVANCLYQKKLNINWGELWSRKIDYLENLISENGIRYPLIVDSFNYFVGLAENAISYYNSMNLDEDCLYVVSHKTIRADDTVEALYNPLNIIFDYRVRDVAEYIKNAFFNKNENIFNEVKAYLESNNLSLLEVNKLIARVLYPSFYFDLYDDILIDGEDEKVIINIVNNISEYESYLDQVIMFFRQFYDIREVEWLKKKTN